MTKVRCSVDNCEFWGKGDVCEAQSIWVKNNDNCDIDIGFSAMDAEFAADFGDESPSAKTSRHTCCETMRPKRY